MAGLRLTTADDVLELMDAAVPAAAVAAAMRLGLFWRLAPAPLELEEIAAALGVPSGRCRPWLELLLAIGLLERREDDERAGAPCEAWALAEAASSAIVTSYSEATWGMLAEEALERLDAVAAFPAALAGSAMPTSPSYVDRMAADAGRARRFCRMLYELHEPLARRLGTALDLVGARSLLDLGGGSGVVAIELARRQPDLRVTVLDIPTVCDAGREIVAEHGLSDRIEFLAGDFLVDELPAPFDVVLECDVGVYSDQLFERVRRALRPGGRFVIVDELGDRSGSDIRRLSWQLLRAVADKDFAASTAASITETLEAVGFPDVVARRLPPIPGIGGRIADDVYLIEARRDADGDGPDGRHTPRQALDSPRPPGAGRAQGLGDTIASPNGSPNPHRAPSSRVGSG